ncbi:hypothetical protein COCCADRAFT_90485, partial [Bipolaris zeicola 26-R-13]
FNFSTFFLLSRHQWWGVEFVRLALLVVLSLFVLHLAADMFMTCMSFMMSVIPDFFFQENTC